MVAVPDMQDVLSELVHHQRRLSGSIRSQYARHFGGSNLGFADGHAKWIASEAMLAPRSDCALYTPYCDGQMAIATPQTCGVYCCGFKL